MCLRSNLRTMQLLKLAQSGPAVPSNPFHSIQSKEGRSKI